VLIAFIQRDQCYRERESIFISQTTTLALGVLNARKCTAANIIEKIGNKIISAVEIISSAIRNKYMHKAKSIEIKTERK